MHSINCLNYVILDAINKSFMPNLNNPQKEVISCTKPLKYYSHCIIKPKKVINHKRIIGEWDNIQRVLASLVMGEITQSIIVEKFSSSKLHNRLKKALSEYNDILKSLHLLEFIDNYTYRSAIRAVLSRVESHHKLRRAIMKVGGGKFFGRSVVENEIWNQCTRLIANCIVYYNALLIDETMRSLNEQKIDEYLLYYIKSISPIAWTNVNLNGKYEFKGFRGDINIAEFVVELQTILRMKSIRRTQ